MRRRALLAALFAGAVLCPAGLASAASPPKGRPIVIGQSFEVRSAILGGARRINVYLPQHYGEAGRRFPVLFLLDGGEAEDFHHITGLVQVAGAYGAAEELIVVGIEGVDRKHDLTSRPTDPADLKDFPTSGGADAYRRFLVEELQPWVAARYSVTGHTALIGESLAGLFVVETFLSRPGAFNDYIAVSPSLWWDAQALSRGAEADLRKGQFAGRRLWLSIGDEGGTMQQGVERLVAALRTVNPSGLKWTYDPRPGEKHDTIYDPAAIAAIRGLYAQPR